MSSLKRGRSGERSIGLLLDEACAKLPLLYSTEREPDPMVWLKFFVPNADWTWYVIEFDGDDLFYGYVIGFEEESATPGYRNWKVSVRKSGFTLNVTIASRRPDSLNSQTWK